jgi:hypothetical protein
MQPSEIGHRDRRGRTGVARLLRRLAAAAAAVAEQMAQVVRERFSAAGIDDAEVTFVSGDGFMIAAPVQARADVIGLVERGRVAIYDWERSVVGPPASGARGGDAERAISRDQAETRAAAHLHRSHERARPPRQPEGSRRRLRPGPAFRDRARRSDRRRAPHRPRRGA